VGLASASKRSTSIKVKWRENLTQLALVGCIIINTPIVYMNINEVHLVSDGQHLYNRLYQQMSSASAILIRSCDLFQFKITSEGMNLFDSWQDSLGTGSTNVQK
jgi:hypothetical protein